MEKVCIILFDVNDDVIVRQSLEFRETEMEKNKLIHEHLLYLINFCGQDSEIARIEIVRYNLL